MFILFQYGGFLLTTFLLEITVVMAMYVYREKLLEEFGTRLNLSIETYTMNKKARLLTSCSPR